MSFTAIQTPNIRPISGDLTGEGLERYARNPHVSESDKIAEASRQFEAVLLRQILSEARKTVIRSGMEEESSATDVYQDMINAHLADAITGAGGLGLARSLQLQVNRPSQPLDDQETVPEGDLRSVTGFTHDGFQARHD